MADNYIERQQEQYEARKAAWKQAQKYGKKKTTTSSQVKTEVAGEIVSKSDRLVTTDRGSSAAKAGTTAKGRVRTRQANRA